MVIIYGITVFRTYPDVAIPVFKDVADAVAGQAVGVLVVLLQVVRVVPVESRVGAYPQEAPAVAIQTVDVVV